MRPLNLLPVLLLSISISPAFTIPPPLNDFQAVLAQKPFSSIKTDRLASTVQYGEDFASHLLSDAKQAILKGKSDMQKWYHKGKEYIKQNGLLYEFVSHPAFEKHTLRVTEPELCDSTVKQYSGYLDVAEDKHLFFWFFEARNSPETAPLVLWLNGGPGCSSATGLLFELGPCSITKESASSPANTTFNPYSWTQHANIIFLDQPVNVGFSYAENGNSVNSSPVAGKDVYAFLQLFLGRFKEYSHLPFHIAAESYGGTYAPNFASVIHKGNKELALKSSSNLVHIPLSSVILANGLTDPLIQYASIPDYACDGPYPVLAPDDPRCASLRAKVSTCERLVQACYNYESRWSCVPALAYCNSQLMGPIIQTGLNPYDVRIPCDREKNGQLCYGQMNWIDEYLNVPANKAALGVDPTKNFESCNMEVNQAFSLNGDGAHNSAKLLPELINEGVRLLVYAGNADMMCNYMGNERWVNALDTKFTSEFQAAPPLPWVDSYTGRTAGEVRSAGGGGFGAGNVSFVNVYEAGHMVPYNQPEAALDMFTRWIQDIPLSFKWIH
ncbi:carboxypeptidase C [Cyathus striatus]|nr:carboxypeptidase C [Cyathus striatus]